jgi:catechol 2,3-dioxygenase-like lactoylglutathione lyase family enzyme
MQKDLPDYALKVAMFETANLTIELLQYADGDTRFVRGVMGDRVGINHISARVDDLKQRTGELEGAGFEVQEGFPRQGAHGQVTFFKPDNATGILLELCQPDEGTGR